MTRFTPLIPVHHAKAGRCDPSRHRARLTVSTCLSGLAACALIGLSGPLVLGTAAQAQTLPTGGSVAAGDAVITTGPGAMTINQSSRNAAINWQTFSIGEGGSVVFIQPDSRSVALNRVVGPDASAIFGSLTANG
ncbi:MAG: filamentous hemagglutinin N-terminal domain-containing protein, partial [Brevundimonas sp.]